ncbi:hypothetical protein K438DRAFT_2015579 [Mycena galopus ATCC 62051]|nr:hypothetical protein K438DRAFT_2015579 [Mycena galopus ATCC 62051]
MPSNKPTTHISPKPHHTIRHPVRSSKTTSDCIGIASCLLGWLLSRSVLWYLTSTLQPSLDVPLDTFNIIISQNLSYTSMGYAAPLFERTSPLAATSSHSGAQSSPSMIPLCAIPFILVSPEIIAVDANTDQAP